MMYSSRLWHGHSRVCTEVYLRVSRLFCGLFLDNLSLQEHATNNRFIPVRPIVRGNADDHQQRQQLHITTNGDQLSTSSTSTAIGVVIPTTPVSQQDAVSQRIDPNETLLQKILNPRSRTAAAASQPSLDSSSSVFRLIQPSRRQQQYSDHHSNHREQRQQAATSKHLDDRILEIKDYIRTTSSLIHSIHQDSVRYAHNCVTYSVDGNRVGVCRLSKGKWRKVNTEQW